MRKDDFTTPDERAAWDRGYEAAVEHRGPRHPLLDTLDDALPDGVSFTQTHPLNKELMADAFEDPAMTESEATAFC